jgi:aldehyde dehydrogenase (NAD+)
MNRADLSSLIDRGRSLYIGGDWITSTANDGFDVVVASTEEMLGRIAFASEADIDLAVKAARDAFDNGPWPQLSPSERATYLLKIADALEARSDEAATIWTSESGAVAGLAQHASPMSAQVFRYYAGLAETFLFEETHQPAEGDVGLLVREPVGVVAAILPWNGCTSIACGLHRHHQDAARSPLLGHIICRYRSTDRPASGRDQRNHGRPWSIGIIGAPS